MKLHRVLALALLSHGAAFPAFGEEAHVAHATEFMNMQVKPWLSDPVVIDAILAQNRNHAGLNQAGIEALDEAWRKEVHEGPSDMINGVLSTELSKFLMEKQEAAGGTITEIFVMDNRGLNVGQSEITSDYWQGDEAKFQKTFGTGTDVLFVDQAEKDASTQQIQSQVSMTITDAGGTPIGAITVGIRVGAL
ncbi:hypothetical protein [Rhizobium sp. L1K21]|uniref:hypothetical protein n=1 Tax=Rhizobium sp. L1K21 TaxID=2954933 RepID=UPI0020938D51|nr:hypothetical protein [Rhizobium sp. L1K21]MCO6186247.1 hypothetical protein [Rhizobium sp. L1K21]